MCLNTLIKAKTDLYVDQWLQTGFHTELSGLFPVLTLTTLVTNAKQNSDVVLVFKLRYQTLC